MIPEKERTIISGMKKEGLSLKEIIESFPSLDASEIEKYYNSNGTIPPEVQAIAVSDRQLVAISNDIMTAIVNNNDPPTVFVQGGKMARVTNDEEGYWIAEPFDENALRGYLARIRGIQFVKIRPTSKGPSYLSVPPPLDSVRDLLSLPGYPDLPPLAGIIEAPVVRPDGTILDKEGYDEKTHLYLKLDPTLKIPPIPENPTAEEFENAKNLVLEPFIDFPFDSDASRANAHGLLFTPAIRPMHNHCAPLHVIGKPQAGTGASLMTESECLIHTGRTASIMTAPDTDEEWRKHITAILMRGQAVAVFDNLQGVLYAPSLAAVLTSHMWEDRLLGASKMCVLHNNTTWMATGNNISLSGDLPRRCIWSKLDAKMAQPWLARDQPFKHPHLLEWVRENRGAILAAILTCVRAWVVAGKPLYEENTIGNFESWCRITGGILKVMGIEGFLGNLQQMYAEADVDTPQWARFLDSLEDKFGEDEFTTAIVIKLAGTEGEEDFKSTIPDSIMTRKDRDQSRVMGVAFRKKKGMRFPNGLMLTQEGQQHKVARWKVQRFKDDPDNPNKKAKPPKPAPPKQSELGESVAEEEDEPLPF